ncbi:MULTISPECIES: potassium-transporting ATPase subunit KdpC [unclassified Microbacterium]|uniref:potassium-transporting ATPase subunit KdpC n=1 Tax=unclassified Microbacterium TaxID=2609290 RepID=UPI000EA9DEBC|nr:MULTISPECIES: potassium-transporting ATPase subunit KdpC [unclassified Microbacterium]MBT2484380.1 potassium-transporting ATPase subunit KdpC [Microbacterium sp. ISL-108]RKN67292.1 potassium-transporting ATPase subunit KdpC [Microbacterium sp. CGR2]
MSSTRSTVRTAGVAVRAILVLTLVLGVGYTLLVTGIGQLALPWQANGSPLDGDRGSALIGQSFQDAEGDALPEYFQSRPSAAGDGYDGTASGGSNLGPENPDLVAAIEERRSAIAEREGVSVDGVPADAVTASASGLDPHISVAYALLQVTRVAEARGLSTEEVRTLVESRIQGRDLGFLGEQRINVAELNLALDDRESE